MTTTDNGSNFVNAFVQLWDRMTDLPVEMDNWSLLECSKSKMAVPLEQWLLRARKWALNGPRGIAYREESKIFIADSATPRFRF